MPEYSFSQQVERLLALGLPELFGLGARQFQARIDSLAAHVPLARLAGAGQFRFLLVLQGKCLPVRELLSRVDRRGHRAIERLHPLTPEQFRPAPYRALRQVRIATRRHWWLPTKSSDLKATSGVSLEIQTGILRDR